MMANPRRSSVHLQSISVDQGSPAFQQQQSSSSSPPPLPLFSVFAPLVGFLKRPHAFPFLLSVFVLLTWISLRFQHHPHSSPYRSSPFTSSSSQEQSGSVLASDAEASLVRFSAVEFPSRIARDRRGWLLNPVTAAREAGISGGAQSCASVHVGQIRPGGIRGNHRHHTCNETFIIWGAETKFRVENARVEDKGYAEVTIGVDEIAIAASPSGAAHALINIDPSRATYFLGCQDSVLDYNSSTTEFNVWNDL